MRVFKLDDVSIENEEAIQFGVGIKTAGQSRYNFIGS